MGEVLDNGGLSGSNDGVGVERVDLLDDGVPVVDGHERPLLDDPIHTTVDTEHLESDTDDPAASVQIRAPPIGGRRLNLEVEADIFERNELLDDPWMLARIVDGLRLQVAQGFGHDRHCRLRTLLGDANLIRSQYRRRWRR